MRSYLVKDFEGNILERPQHMLMRVALGIHGSDLEAAFETYLLMAQGICTHASPTLFNAGTPNPQMSSCFLVCLKEDSLQGIFDTIKTCAVISKYSGGIGLALTNLRAGGSLIRGTAGRTSGIVPMLKVLNNTARFVNQGAGKRMGSFAV